MKPTDIQNLINPHLVAKYYEVLKQEPEKYSRKRYYYKGKGKLEDYIALGVAKALINSEA